jgi:hypothetical protein
MTRRHLRLRQPGWHNGLLINGLGGTVTLLVLVVITITKFTHGAWMVVLAVPLLVWLLLRTQGTYRSELGELRVEVSDRMAPPKPRHEVVVLVEALDRATIGALQYARQLNPLRLTALHIAVDPERAKELSSLWARVNVPAPLEVVDAPDRNLLATTQATVAELVRPDTEVTVLVPKRQLLGRAGAGAGQHGRRQRDHRPLPPRPASPAPLGLLLLVVMAGSGGSCSRRR